MSHPADPAGRPADGPSYGQEAPYGPPSVGDAGPTAAPDAAPAGASWAGGDRAGGYAAGTPSPGGDASDGHASAGQAAGEYATPGAAYGTPGAAYGTPGAQPGGTYGAYGATPYAGPGYWPRNDLGVWSLVLGIAGLVLACGFFTGIPAVIVGMNARRAIARGEANNDGMVTAGIVLGWISTAFGVLMVVLFVLSFLIPLVFLGVTLPWASEMSSSGY